MLPMLSQLIRSRPSALIHAASVLAIGLLSTGCGEQPSTAAAPQLLSVEAARIENVSALERLGVEQLAMPTPARFIEFEACVGKSNTCLESQQKADRID
jgi:hypothetical protein